MTHIAAAEFSESKGGAEANLEKTKNTLRKYYGLFKVSVKTFSIVESDRVPAMSSVIRLLARKARKPGRKYNGFTLVELLVVVTIIGALVGVGAPQILAALTKGQDAAAKSELTNAAADCTVDLLNGTTNYTTGDYPLVSGSCAKSGTLTGTSDSGNTFTITFDSGGLPGILTAQ